MADSITDFGINLLEEEIDDVIFQTNEFLTDATFTGQSGPFWWLLSVEPLMYLESFVFQRFTNSCRATRILGGTKMGQNHGEIKLKTVFAQSVPADYRFALQRYAFVPTFTNLLP